MQNIKLLDCTLRDGGYVNDWNFGEKSVEKIVSDLAISGVDILEVGFLRDEMSKNGRTIFSNIEEVNNILKNKNPNTTYSAMIEAFNPYPLEKLEEWHKGSVDLIRICIWKRCMKEHLEYCKAVKDKGYQITIQPSRVEQYSSKEFIDLMKKSNELDPYAVYVVDTWGTQSSSQICHYLELADRYLDKNIKLGYHGHNNKLQALTCAQKAIEMDLSRDLCIDASIMGMGRGAGNLNTELIMEYLNDICGKSYDINMVVNLFNECLKEVYDATPWGYSMYYFLSSKAECNPNYATYFSEQGYSEALLERVLQCLSEHEKVVFSKAVVEEKIKRL